MAEQSKQLEASRNMLKAGLQIGIPLILGYIPVALAYGVLASQAGLSLFELTMMSMLVYAGASQFMGVNMIVAGSTAIEIIVATFVLNFRHFVMSFSFMNELKDHVSLKGKLGLAAVLTDESFAVSSLNKDKIQEEKGIVFYAVIHIIGYLAWVLASLAGGLLGEVIPDQLSQSMGIALFAMFIGLLVPSVKKNIKFGLIAIIAMLVNLLASSYVSSGWSIIIGTLVGGLAGVYFLKEKEEV